ncbi:hypothetical protein [Kaistia sp. UC242_56]|uniref:hypothetical protein n=1 Tax=Kaistia sp. UC242_56 TaxID=3374625 RepID=UPI0037A43AD0
MFAIKISHLAIAVSFTSYGLPNGLYLSVPGIGRVIWGHGGWHGFNVDSWAVAREDQREFYGFVSG